VVMVVVGVGGGREGGGREGRGGNGDGGVMTILTDQIVKVLCTHTQLYTGIVSQLVIILYLSVTFISWYSQCLYHRSSMGG
jgi:hypothetical protein